MEAKQWQKLCEWAGFKEDLCVVPVWYHNGYRAMGLPPQDMNTLFRWMVPKFGSGWHIDCYNDAYLLKWVCTISPSGYKESDYREVFGETPDVNKSINEDPFEALAQAIYKVVKGDQDVETR